MNNRFAQSQVFVQSAGWGRATRHHLAGDASARSYDRLTLGGKTAVLMDAPPGHGDDPAIFVSIAAHLASLNLSAPKILAEDLTLGFLLLEDLGDALYSREISRHAALEPALYTAATDVLIHLQSSKPAESLPDLSPPDWAEAATFALDWYQFAITGHQVGGRDYVAALTDLISTHANGPRVMILRDYHAENLLWLPDRTGIARVGLLDFQLAQLGQPGYDLVSLLQDARRDVSPQIEAAMMARMVAATGAGAAAFHVSYAVLGAQRALRILGIFAKLCMQDGKSHYLPLIPRVWGQLQRNLAHPALAPLASICANLLPDPSPENLHKIGLQCARHPAP